MKQQVIRRHTNNHRHVLEIESAHKQQTFLVQAESVGRYVLQQNIPVDVCQQYVISVALEQGSIAAICLNQLSYTVRSGVVIGGDSSYDDL